jgi:hypothetical protein
MPPRPIAATRFRPLSLTPDFETWHPSSGILLSDDFGFGVTEDPLLSGLRTLGLVVLGFVTFSFVLSVVVATFVIPAAAKELEDNVKTQYPDLWSEYQGKMEEGETLMTRPDLMAELGRKMQTLQMEQFDKVAAAVMAEGDPKEEGGSGTDKKSDAIDVEITSKIESKEKPDDDP